MKEIRTPLRRLARLGEGSVPVVSVYLNTQWVDEHQRERVRVFLKSRLHEARQSGRAVGADLDWIEAQGRALVDRTLFVDANGVALFACEPAGLREVLPVRVPFEDTFVVDARPFLRPLARVVEETPAALVVFIDGTRARLIPLDPSGPEAEVVLDSGVEGRHRLGGWAALAQSRYQRHIREHREQHFEAVAAAIVEWSERQGAEKVVLCGEPRMTAALRKHLPERATRGIVGAIAGTRYEPATRLGARAADLLARVQDGREGEAVEAVLAEAAAGSAAVAGLESTLAAVNRGAVRELYVLEAFREAGAACATCGTLQQRFHFRCAFCGREIRATELGEAMVERVLAAGGRVTTVEHHPRLAARDGLAARLRYAEAARA